MRGKTLITPLQDPEVSETGSALQALSGAHGLSFFSLGEKHLQKMFHLG